MRIVKTFWSNPFLHPNHLHYHASNYRPLTMSYLRKPKTPICQNNSKDFCQELANTAKFTYIARLFGKPDKSKREW